MSNDDNEPFFGLFGYDILGWVYFIINLISSVPNTCTKIY